MGVNVGADQDALGLGSLRWPWRKGTQVRFFFKLVACGGIMTIE